VGRVARCHGLPQMHHDTEVIGHMARTVDDLALILSATQGAHPLDRSSLAFARTEREPREAGRRRILYVPRFGDCPVDEPIAESTDDIAKNLVALGHEVEIGEAPFDIARFERGMTTMGLAGLAWLLRDTNWRGRIGDEYAAQIEQGQRISAIDYYDALDVSRGLFREVATAFQSYNLILTPTAGAMPWSAEQFGPPHHSPFTAFANLVGVPALSIPAGFGPTGMPIGFQLVAPFGADWLLIAMARQYEAAHPWIQRWPDI
jgi:aspartyl-tRNA(Asn)/glutamyl-tRNA(Gln) amidotransferase subunit A